MIPENPLFPAASVRRGYGTHRTDGTVANHGGASQYRQLEF